MPSRMTRILRQKKNADSKAQILHSTVATLQRRALCHRKRLRRTRQPTRRRSRARLLPFIPTTLNSTLGGYPGMSLDPNDGQSFATFLQFAEEPTEARPRNSATLAMTSLFVPRYRAAMNEHLRNAWGYQQELFKASHAS